MEPPRLIDVTALVVERDRESLRLLEAILEPIGVFVVAAQTAAEADLMLHAVLPDIIVCDLVLPSGDGLSLIRRVRKHPDARVRLIPAVAMTTMYEDITAADAQDAGFDVYLRKPIDPEQLPRTIEALVERSAERSAGERAARRPS